MVVYCIPSRQVYTIDTRSIYLSSSSGARHAGLGGRWAMVRSAFAEGKQCQTAMDGRQMMKPPCRQLHRYGTGIMPLSAAVVQPSAAEAMVQNGMIINVIILIIVVSGTIIERY